MKKSQKKFPTISIFISSLFLFFIATEIPVMAFYSDITEENQYYNSIKILYDLDRLPHYENEIFNPETKVTIVDLCELTLAFAQVSLNTNISLPYSNIDPSSETAKIIQTALDTNIIEAIGLNPTLDITSPVAKQYILKTLFQTLGIGTNYFFDKSDFPFTDLDVNSELAPIAQKAAELYILEKDKPQLFSLAKRITRGQLADYLYRIYQNAPNTITIRVKPSNYTKAQTELLDNEKFSIFLDIWDRLKTDFLYQDKLNEDQLIESAIEGLLEPVEEKDKYTTYQNSSEAQAFMDSLSGDYEGIGISIEMIDGKATVITPFKNSPAEKAGLKPNDVILEVNNEDVSDQTLEEIISKIKGEKGTTVTLKILRGTDKKTFEIEREEISQESVSSELLEHNDKKIGYINMMSFNEDGYKKFTEQAKTLLKDKPVGFIIDLRNNPGGYLDVAVNIVGLFTDAKKTALRLEFADGTTQEYITNGNGLLKNYKTIVLINGGSASASEILAGALKDFSLATLIGEKSFGKGSVQEIITYYDESLLKFTIAKWLTPNGTNVNEVGIVPDKEVVENPDTTTDEQLQAALDEF